MLKSHISCVLLTVCGFLFDLATSSGEVAEILRRSGGFSPCMWQVQSGICNFAENAIRPFVIGRKNWLFSDTAKGAESSAIVYTLVETAKAYGLDPYKYLLRLLEELPYLGRNPSPNDLVIFMPWQPAVRAACASSVSSKSSGDL